MRIAVALAFVAVFGSSFALATDARRPTTTATSSGASATPVTKQNSLKACNKRADAKSLTGAQRSAFVKSCRGGKPQG
jgi:psiF repeat